MKPNHTETMPAQEQVHVSDEKKTNVKKRAPSLEKAVYALSETDAKELLLHYARKNTACAV